MQWVSDALPIRFFWELRFWSKLGLKPYSRALFQCKAVNLQAISSRRATNSAFLSGFVLKAAAVKILMPSEYHKPDDLDAQQWVENCVGAAFKSFYLFFQPCNLAVFKLFYKDLWEQWKVVLSPEHLSAHCALAGWVLGRQVWNVIWSGCPIELTGITQSPPPPWLLQSDASASVVQ